MPVSETCRIYTLYTKTPNGLDCQFSLDAFRVKTVCMTVLLPASVLSRRQETKRNSLIIFDRFQYLELVNKENDGSGTIGSNSQLCTFSASYILLSA